MQGARHDAGVRRTVLVVGIVVVVAVIAVVGIRLRYARTPPPFRKLEAILKTFPAPKGAIRGSPARYGRHCFLNPTCEQVRVGVLFDIPESERISCREFRAWVLRWPGFRAEAPDGDYCTVTGRIAGRPAFAQTLTGRLDSWAVNVLE